MAFPVDQGRQPTDGATAIDPIVVSMPASVAVGELLVMMVRANNPTSVTNPSGWNQLVNLDVVGTELDDNIILITYRVADGTEGATVNVDTGAAAKFSAIVWRISGAADPNSQPPELSTHAFSTGSTSVDPTTVTPTGGTKDYLFLWLGGNQGETTSPPGAAASGYTNLVGANSGIGGATTSNNRAYGCTRQASVSSEDPGAITISGSESWSAWVMAIHPAAAAAVTLAAWVRSL